VPSASRKSVDQVDQVDQGEPAFADATAGQSPPLQEAAARQGEDEEKVPEPFADEVKDELIEGAGGEQVDDTKVPEPAWLKEPTVLSGSQQIKSDDKQMGAD
jgi:hypothetical protein